jgi:hypothetical protein
VYYNCVKFHKNSISSLVGVALTRYMDGRTWRFLYTPLPNFACGGRGYRKEKKNKTKQKTKKERKKKKQTNKTNKKQPADMKEYGCCPKFKRGDNSTYTFTKRGGGHVPCKHNSY